MTWWRFGNGSSNSVGSIGSTTTDTFSGTVNAGDLLWAWVSDIFGGTGLQTINSVTDSLGNTYTNVFSVSDGSQTRLDLYAVRTKVGGVNPVVTVRFASAADTNGLAIGCSDGAIYSRIYGSTAGATGTVTPAAPGTLSAGALAGYLFAATMPTVASWTGDLNFTPRYNFNGTGSATAFAVGDREVNGSQSPSDIFAGGSGTWGAGLVAFLPPNAPFITADPTSQTVFEGNASGNFSVTAIASAGSNSYQWNVNGAAESGATSQTFSVIKPIGVYSITCDVTDSNGVTTSAAATLSVLRKRGLGANNKRYSRRSPKRQGRIFELSGWFNPMLTLRGWFMRDWLSPSGGPFTIAVGQAEETDLAQAVTRLKLKAVGQNAETDLAQALTRLKTRLLVQTTETDLSQTHGRLKTKAVAQASETDLAQVVARVKLKAVGQNAETDLAQSLTRLKLKAVGQPSETDAAQAVTWVIRRLIVQAVEADAAQSLMRVKSKALGQAAETDLAQVVSWVIRRLIAQASETDLAQALTRLKTRAVGQSSETDLAQALARLKRRTLGQAQETDEAQPVAEPGTTLVPVAQASETDLAQALSRLKLKLIGQPSETDAAQSITRVRIHSLGQTAETDLAQALTHAKRKSVGQAAETDAAQAVGHARAILIGQAAETALALALTHAKRRALGQAEETDSAFSVAVVGVEFFRSLLRTFRVPAETRLLLVVGEDRTLVITPEDRTIVITPENRTLH